MPGIEEMIGLFINTVPVRIALDYGETLGELCVRVQAEQAALLDHHQLGLTEIQHAAGPGAGFDTLTVFESYPVEREALARTAERTGVELVGANGLDATHYPLTVVARIAADRLALSLKYQPELLDPARVEAIATRLAHVLRAVVTDPELPVGRVDLLDPAERELVLEA